MKSFQGAFTGILNSFWTFAGCERWIAMMQSVYYSFRKVTCIVTCTTTCTEVMFDTYTTVSIAANKVYIWPILSLSVNEEWQLLKKRVVEIHMVHYIILIICSELYKHKEIWKGHCKENYL